jgi:uncharacterized protein
VASTITLPLAVARRLALRCQLLAGPRPKATREGILEVVERIGCLQIDPTNVVARSQLLVLFSRLGCFDPALLDRLAYTEHRLFEYWAHQASYVLADDYPLMRLQMRTGLHERVRRWLEDNAAFREHVLSELRDRGPLRGREIEDRSVRPWASTGWSNSRNTERLLTFLSVEGVALPAGRAGNEKLWDLGQRCLPDDVSREELPDEEIVRRCAVRALRALGPATARHVRDYFIRDAYPNLEERLSELQAAGVVVPVTVAGPDGPLRGDWLVLAELLPLADELAGGFRGRTTLLSPFDNLICNRDRTLALFGFRCKLEIYVPKEKREWGFFVLPILHGDRLIGRADPRLDRKTGTLHVESLLAEADAPPKAAPHVAKAIAELARFVGAERVVYERVDPVFEAVRG